MVGPHSRRGLVGLYSVSLLFPRGPDRAADIVHGRTSFHGRRCSLHTIACVR